MSERNWPVIVGWAVIIGVILLNIFACSPQISLPAASLNWECPEGFFMAGIDERGKFLTCEKP